jgi:DNA-binding GntR family transcriptional regulator
MVHDACAAGRFAATAAMPAAAGPVERRLLHEEGVERLREMIIRGELGPGMKLNERVLAERLGISRTPLREAIRFLASEGLVELLPNRGAVVAPIDAERVRQTLLVLGALEALAGELVCAHATDAELAEIGALHAEMLVHHARRDLAGYFRCNQRIHARIVECSGNAPLIQTCRALNAQVRRARYMANLSPARWRQAVREHEAMQVALDARDGAKLAALLREHLAQKLAAVLGVLAGAAEAETPRELRGVIAVD